MSLPRGDDPSVRPKPTILPPPLPIPVCHSCRLEGYVDSADWALGRSVCFSVGLALIMSVGWLVSRVGQSVMSVGRFVSLSVVLVSRLGSHVGQSLGWLGGQLSCRAFGGSIGRLIGRRSVSRFIGPSVGRSVARPDMPVDGLVGWSVSRVG